MITCKNSPFSDLKLGRACLFALGESLLGKYDFDKELEIRICFDAENENYKVFSNVSDALEFSKSNVFIKCVDESYLTACEKLLDRVAVFLKCDHELVRQVDEFGVEFPDKRSHCVRCDLDFQGGLQVIPGKSVINMSSGADVVASFSWPEIKVQGGRSGLVLGSGEEEHYTTAFCEAFPTVSGFGTFIRGEGKGIREAEQQCWDSYQRKVNCKEHEWTRVQRGETRVDGYATCINCGLGTSEALPPLTLCHVCDRPTNNMSGKDEYVCFQHYFEMGPKETLPFEIEMHKSFSGGECVAGVAFKHFLKFELTKMIFSRVGVDVFDKRESCVNSIFYRFQHILLSEYFGQKFLTRLDVYPEVDHLDVVEQLQYFEKNLDEIVKYVSGDTKTLAVDKIIKY